MSETLPSLTANGQKLIDRLKRKIVIAENTNLRTKNKTDAQMIRDIKKWIEEEVQCCSNQ